MTGGTLFKIVVGQVSLLTIPLIFFGLLVIKLMDWILSD